jgi:exopolysaccharide biosynthesis polyprenyl glycosylphosphotransferase
VWEVPVETVRGADPTRMRWFGRDSASWVPAYRSWAVVADCVCALAAGLIALGVRYHGYHRPPLTYIGFTLALPIAWWLAVTLAGGYESRFFGVGPEEFRRVLNAGVCLTAGFAVVAYATKSDLSRGYAALALPTATVFDLFGRFALRKRLHRLRQSGGCMQKVVAVGYSPMIADLTTMLRKATYHGLSVVAACVADPEVPAEIGGIPVVGGIDSVTDAVERFEADTVAVLACPEMSGVRLRELAWRLETTSTELCVASALLDVAGPRTTIRPVAGLPLLHLDHPEFTGVRWLVKSSFDRGLGCFLLLACLPVFVLVATVIRYRDGGPVIFRQKRVGKDGQLFVVYKFRTMVTDAETRREQLAALNESDGVLFKIRDDPRVTPVGAWLRRWSLDELPQLLNVVRGDMSLVGPRPALPEEAALYGDHVRRRLVVKPGITGLWQVNGRSDLSWDESVRLDLRYVENWSFMFDLQILWKTWKAIRRGVGAY